MVALGVGVPAALLVHHRSVPSTFHNGHQDFKSHRPGCYIDAQPFSARSYYVTDAGFLFNLIIVVVFYLLAIVIMSFLLMMVWCRKTKNSKYQRYVKILIWYCVIYAITRSPIDIVQLSELCEVAMTKFRQTHPFEMEYEILIVWATYIPLIAHPMIYLSYCSEFRKGSKAALKEMCGGQVLTEEEKDAARLDNYKEKEILEARSTVSKTQSTEML